MKKNVNKYKVKESNISKLKDYLSKIDSNQIHYPEAKNKNKI